MEHRTIKSKSMKYQKKTMMKIPLRCTMSATGNHTLPTVVLTPSTRNNSVVPELGHEDLRHLAIPHDLGEDGLHYDQQIERRKVSVMSVLSFMANNSQRPSIFSKYRWTAIFNIIQII